MTLLHIRHHIYDINILDCYRNLISKLEKDSTFSPKIEKREFYFRLRNAVSSYARLKGFQPNFTEFAKKQIFYIDQENESFNNWLCYRLSISEPHEVNLLLDHFCKNSAKPKARFINEMEFYLLRLMKTQIFHEIPEIKMEVATWIRDEKSKLTQKQITDGENYNDSGKYHNSKPLSYNMDNLQAIEEYIDRFAPFEWLNSMPKDKEENSVASTDDRLETDLSPEEIMRYFNKLNRTNRKGQTIMQSSDIERLVQSNFKGFDKLDRTHLTVNTTKEALKKFVYDFYMKEDQCIYPGKQVEYCTFLIDNFELFKNDDPEILSKKLSSANPKNYPFH